MRQHPPWVVHARRSETATAGDKAAEHRALELHHPSANAGACAKTHTRRAFDTKAAHESSDLRRVGTAQRIAAAAPQEVVDRQLRKESALPLHIHTERATKMSAIGLVVVTWNRVTQPGRRVHTRQLPPVSG